MIATDISIFGIRPTIYCIESILQIMATKRVHNPVTHMDMHIAERDSKNYTKGQFTGRYKNKPIKKMS
jgi:hypothetical protein